MRNWKDCCTCFPLRSGVRKIAKLNPCMRSWNGYTLGNIFSDVIVVESLVLNLILSTDTEYRIPKLVG